MPFRKYAPEEKEKMALIYAECGGKGRHIQQARQRIKDEMGIVIPVDGRQLREWFKKYIPKTEVKSDNRLFPEIIETPIKTAEVISGLMPVEEFQERLQAYAGDTIIEDKQILNSIHDELRHNRIKESLQGKSIEELYKLRGMIEEQQQKRETHMLKMISFIDYRKGNQANDLYKYDEEILAELDRDMEEKK
jgi:hypothetical protein